MLTGLEFSDSEEEEEEKETKTTVRYVGAHHLKIDEQFDQHKLNYLLQNRDKYTKILRDSGRASDLTYDPFRKPAEYLLASDDGIFKANYWKVSQDNMGRLFAKGGLGLQNFCKEIRHTIAGDLYHDIDMKNAHPVILQNLCRKHDISCTRLTQYIDDRENIIQDVIDANDGKTRGYVKACILSMINGGSEAYRHLMHKTRWIKSFNSEVKLIKAELEAEFNDFFERVKAEHVEKESAKRDYRDSALNLMFCDIENKTLMHMLEYLSGQEVFSGVGVLCFDGVMIRKNLPPGIGIDSIISGCSEYISEKMGFQIDLAAKPMDEGFELPSMIPEYKSVGIDATDPYTWLDFDKDYRGKLFDSVDDCKSALLYDVQRVFAIIEQGTRKIVKKSDCDANLTDIVQGSAQFTDLYFLIKGKKKPKELTFVKYMAYAAGGLRRYKSIGFAPGSTDRDIFNLFTGYKATLLSSYDMSVIKRPCLHLLNVICNGDEGNYEYLMRWLAFVLQHPDRRTGVVPLLCSEVQGTGKNSIFQFLSNCVVGPHMCREVTGLGPILEKHNTVLQGRKLLGINEASSSRATFCENFDKLKSLITDDTIWIDPKGKDGFSIRNLLEIYITTNHPDSIRIEPSDRRYFALDVGDSRAGDVQYFNKLHKSFTDRAGDHFLTYAIREFGGEGQLGPPPMTKLKQTMTNTSLPGSVRFILEKPWGEGKDDSDDDSESDDDNPEARDRSWSADELYGMYVKWCEMNGERATRKNAFQQKIKKHVREVIHVIRGRYRYFLDRL